MEDGEDQDVTETTLLCPNNPSEIVITPITLGNNPDVFTENTENISLSQFNPDPEIVTEDI